MRIYDIIEKKRDKLPLSKEEIEYFINGYINKEIPDYQASALLMAIYLNGMNINELTYLTDKMSKSGDMIDLRNINGITVDKHSTGGVGDKTTLIIGPILACTGLKFAKMSGRGLGHTGGTIDKLESIPGLKAQLSNNEFINQVNNIGIALVSQTGNLAPADKMIYALRDATATVESIPLIASSIMSKKLASGANTILLDVKMGSGAFMKNIEDARLLAKTMVDIGKNNNRKTRAIITNMDVPLGSAIGNILEVKEAIETLNGNGSKDLTDLCTELCCQIINLATNKPFDECKKEVTEILQSKKALNKLVELVHYQNGNVDYIKNPLLFETSPIIRDIVTNESGYITSMNTEEIGRISTLLGAGRNTKEDTIDYSAGIIIKAKTGDYIKEGDILAQLHTSKEEVINEAKELYINSITIAETPNETTKLIYEIIK